MKRRVLTVLLISIMAISFMPTMAFAGDKTFTSANGLEYIISGNYLMLIKANSNFDGHLHYSEIVDGQEYTVIIDEPIEWKASVSTLFIPANGVDITAYELQNAVSVKQFAIDPGARTDDVDTYSVINGCLYENDFSYGYEGYVNLVMIPPAGKLMEVFEMPEKCCDLYENAFDYSQAKESITKLIINSDQFYINEMDYKDSTSLFERLALKSDGKYNLTIRIPSPINSNNITSFYEFASWCQKNGKEGIKLEAPIESIYVKDVTYANRNKAKVYFGDVQLKKGEDYVLGDCNKVGNKLSNYNYCTLITGDNSFFLGSDEEPWYDFSVVSEYAVTPNKVKSVKITGGKKKLTFKWKADKTKYGKSKNITGYELAYENCDTVDFKYKKVKGYKKTSATVKNLKKGSYYVKMRSYKSLGGGEYVYSAWSTEKVIEVK